jgi:precorrin-2 dehydrogenase / sirohydrochlorin ferrochelatase
VNKTRQDPEPTIIQGQLSPGPRRYDYPVVMSVTGLRCLMVGGGPVAVRRVRGLLACGARVTVVAPRVVPAMEALAVAGPAASGPRSGGTLEIHRRHYQVGEAARYDLAATATGVAEVDASVVADATSVGVPVAGADRDRPGTFQLPAVHREGPVTVAVSTGGGSPALARWLRDRIAASLPPGTATVALLVEEARVALRAAGRSPESVDWPAVLDQHVVPLVGAGKIAEARALLLDLGGPAGGQPAVG